MNFNFVNKDLYIYLSINLNDYVECNFQFV